MKRLQDSLASFDPRTRSFGAGRSILAFAQLTVVVFTTPDALLQPLVGIGSGPLCNGIRVITLYCVGGESLGQETRRWIMICILIVVMSGYRPRITCFLHAWVAISLGWSISLPDGGEQVARIVALLLVPLSLADNRKWHWTRPVGDKPLLRSSVALACLVSIRIQLAVIYLQAGLAKLSVEAWSNGSAEYYFVRDPMFGASGIVFDFMRWLTSIPVTVAMLTWGAILVELLIGVLILGPHRWRQTALGFDIALHVVIVITMGLWSFALVMVGTSIIAASEHHPRSSSMTAWDRQSYGAGRLRNAFHIPFPGLSQRKQEHA